MSPLATLCHTLSFHFKSIKFKILVAKQHQTITCTIHVYKDTVSLFSLLVCLSWVEDPALKLTVHTTHTNNQWVLIINSYCPAYNNSCFTTTRLDTFIVAVEEASTPALLFSFLLTFTKRFFSCNNTNRATTCKGITSFPSPYSRYAFSGL